MTNVSAINKRFLEEAELTIPLIFLVFYFLILLQKGKIQGFLLYIIIVVFPLIFHFLTNSLASQKQCQNSSEQIFIPIPKSITFFYSGLIPFFSFTILTIIIEVKTFVGFMTFLGSLFYSSLLSGKYFSVYTSGSQGNENKMDLIIASGTALVLYSYFSLYIF